MTMTIPYHVLEMEMYQVLEMEMETNILKSTHGKLDAPNQPESITVFRLSLVPLFGILIWYLVLCFISFPNLLP